MTQDEAATVAAAAQLADATDRLPFGGAAQQQQQQQQGTAGGHVSFVHLDSVSSSLVSQESGEGGSPGLGGPSEGAPIRPRSGSSTASITVSYAHRPSRYISTAGVPQGAQGLQAEESENWALGDKGPFGQRARLRRHVIIRINKGVHQILELQVA